MGIEGLTSLCFSSKLISSSSSLITSHTPRSSFCYSPSQPSFTGSVMRRDLEMAETVITKWNPESTANALFHHNRREALHFIHTVNNLQKAMHFLIEENSCVDQLARARDLMHIAMKRLEREFCQILSVNLARLEDDDSDDVRAMADLRAIADCMISSGYAKECVKIYRSVRKSVVDEGMYRLGVERISSSRIHKMEWRDVEVRIQNWLHAVTIAVKIIFNGERILCDHVFACSDPVRESCFTEITKQAATNLFGFPENVAKNTTTSPDKIFRALDMYAAISDQLPEIDKLFSFQSTIEIKSQALTSLINLAEFTRAALTDFESIILKNSRKAQIPAGAGIHQLTVEVMDYLTILADYSHILSQILSDSPPSEKHSPPQSYLGFSDSDPSPATGITLKMAWIILVLLCKLDLKAERYNDVSLAYLFLANNLQYVVVKVRSSNLKFILGGKWEMKHEFKVKQFAANYERIGWSHVIDCISSDRTAAETPENVKDIFEKFNSLFAEAYRKQCHCVVPDNKLRDDLKSSIARNIVPKYREFYNIHLRTMKREKTAATVVRFTPENMARHLSNLFFVLPPLRS